jgi:putative SOS response-associated peptidase YedK
MKKKKPRSRLYVHFYKRPISIPRKDGKPRKRLKFVDQLWIRIWMSTAHPLAIVMRRATVADKRRFPSAWKKYRELARLPH